MPTIFIADDDLEMRRLLGASLRRAGFEVKLAAGGDELLAQLAEARSLDQEPDLIISDIRMGAMSGLAVLSHIRKVIPLVPIILITAFGDARTHHIARTLGADEILNKPFDLRLLKRTIDTLLAASGR